MDQYLFLHNSMGDLRSFNRMLGRLFSAIQSGLADTEYRIRIFSNDNRENGRSGSYHLRLLGCLSQESTQLDADLNKSLRLKNYVILHTSVNPQVCS